MLLTKREEAIAELHFSGRHTLKEVARISGIKPHEVWRIARAYGQNHAPPSQPSTGHPVSDRNLAIIEAYQSGMTYYLVGIKFGLTTARVGQIIAAYERNTGVKVPRHHNVLTRDPSAYHDTTTPQTGEDVTYSQL